MPESIVIVGASARAAAFSALRAGDAPWTADLFADADLAARCAVRRVTDYPRELEFALDDAPPGPWMYTGALENHPRLIDRMAAKRTLWGNAGDVLRKVRDPWRLAAALREHDLPCPALRRSQDDARSGAWLRKPRQSAGGAGVERVEGAKRGTGDRVKLSGRRGEAKCYYQEYVEGDAVSGAFVAAGGRAQLLGVTRQLVGAAWAGATGFYYAGSIGPIPLNDEQRATWQRIGDCLAERFSLSGLFGVDAIENAQGVFPVEVNPRYTASMELYERTSDVRTIQLHRAACAEGRLQPMRKTSGMSGKAILYARRDGAGSEAFWQWVNDRRTWSIAADLPHRGEVFRRGRPVLTVFAGGADEKEVEQRLQARTQHVFAMLESERPS